LVPDDVPVTCIGSSALAKLAIPRVLAKARAVVI
jgi:hypothetical protein